MVRAFKTQRPAVILTGAPGAGKSTHGRRMQRESPENYIYFCSGDLIRHWRDKHPNSKYGKVFNALPEEAYAPTELLYEAIDQYFHEQIDLKNLPKNLKFILDGIPRNIKQISMVQQRFPNIESVINYEITKEMSIRRQEKRAEKDGRQGENFEKKYQDYIEEAVPMIKELEEIYHKPGEENQFFTIVGHTATDGGINERSIDSMYNATLRAMARNR